MLIQQTFAAEQAYPLPATVLVTAKTPALLMTKLPAQPTLYRLDFDAVQSDSRCPDKGNCFSSGEAVFTLTLTTILKGQKHGDAQTIRLSTRDRSAKILGLGIKIVAVKPYREESKMIPINDYRLFLDVAAP